MKQKFIVIFFAVILAGITVHAQKTEQFNPAKDKRVINDYTIHLVPMPNNAFGFAIVKDKRPVWSQAFNAPRGFKSKDNAYKLAEWVINEESKNGRFPSAIPSSIAKQLGFSTGSPKANSSPVKK